MYESFLLSLNIVLPLFLMMAAGYAFRRIIGLDTAWVQTTNKLVFRLLLPLLLFRNMVESDLSTLSSPGMLSLIAFAVAGTVLTFVLLYLIVPRLEPENPRRGVLIQGILRSNMALFGIPVALSLYGEGNITIVTVLVSFIIPLFNVLAVLSLKLFEGCKPDWKEILKSILTNPLILAIVAGLLCNASGITLPAPVQKAVWALSDCATPISFFVLGASFCFSSAAINRRALTAATLSRLVFVPLIWLTLGVLLGFRNQHLFALMMLFTPPTAVSSYPMACAMKGDGELASEIVVFTSAFSVASIFLWIFVFRALGLI